MPRKLPPPRPKAGSLEAKVARKAPTEDEIHIQIVQAIRRRKAPGVRFFHCPNEGRRSKAYAAKLQRMGVSAGVPDLILIRAPEPVTCSFCEGSGRQPDPLLPDATDPCEDCDGSGELHPWPAFAALELKRPSTRAPKPTPAQAGWLAHFEAAGWHTACLNTVAGALSWLEECGFICPSPHSS